MAEQGAPTEAETKAAAEKIAQQIEREGGKAATTTEDQKSAAQRIANKLKGK